MLWVGRLRSRASPWLYGGRTLGRVTYGPLVTRVQGRVGGVTFSRTSGRDSVYLAAEPRLPPTQLQREFRAAMAAANFSFFVAPSVQYTGTPAVYRNINWLREWYNRPENRPPGTGSRNVWAGQFVRGVAGLAIPTWAMAGGPDVEFSVGVGNVRTNVPGQVTFSVVDGTHAGWTIPFFMSLAVPEGYFLDSFDRRSPPVGDIQGNTDDDFGSETFFGLAAGRWRIFAQGFYYQNGTTPSRANLFPGVPATALVTIS